MGLAMNFLLARASVSSKRPASMRARSCGNADSASGFSAYRGRRRTRCRCSTAAALGRTGRTPCHRAGRCRPAGPQSRGRPVAHTRAPGRRAMRGSPQPAARRPSRASPAPSGPRWPAGWRREGRAGVMRWAPFIAAAPGWSSARSARTAASRRGSPGIRPLQTCDEGGAKQTGQVRVFAIGFLAAAPAGAR
jgi:hypothetical protein